MGHVTKEGCNGRRARKVQMAAPFAAVVFRWKGTFKEVEIEIKRLKSSWFYGHV